MLRLTVKSINFCCKVCTFQHGSQKRLTHFQSQPLVVILGTAHFPTSTIMWPLGFTLIKINCAFHPENPINLKFNLKHMWDPQILSLTGF